MNYSLFQSDVSFACFTKFSNEMFFFVEIHRKISFTSGECVRLSGIKTENYRIVLKHSLHLLHQKPGIAADSRSTHFLRISPRNVCRKIYKYVFLHKKRGKKVTGSNRKDTYQITSLFFILDLASTLIGEPHVLLDVNRYGCIFGRNNSRKLKNILKIEDNRYSLEC